MEKELRNTLRNVVTQCRQLLEQAVAEVLQGQYGIHPDGSVEDAEGLAHLSDEEQLYREQLVIHLEHIKAADFTAKEAVAQLIREIAFTHLNRLCAYKMMEARGLIREAVSRGLKSQGFMFYLAEHPDEEALWSGGQQDRAYRRFLHWLGQTLSQEIGVLFSLNDPANRLFPSQRVLQQVLDLINSPELSSIWAEDEAIGWIYQYFTPKELREQARQESQAPRNSYELAFRNQFFTPRYVVEFLVDNTLGHLWYEMRKGNTQLKDRCRTLIYPPNGTANAPHASPETLQAKPKKDPRELRILDPACGSGHFLLYCYDLLETIYQEAYEDPDLGSTLRQDFPTAEALMRALPGLILQHNLYGVDIDLRATQIASLALWLRAQRSYQALELPSDQRPTIQRTHIVCAEPMPGEDDLLEEFISELTPKVLGQLVQAVFEKMKLADEAGALLKVEEELREMIGLAKKEWLDRPKAEQLALFATKRAPQHEQLSMFDFSGITDEAFWEEAEERVLEALKAYAERATNGKGFHRRLFADDAVQGFAFVDACQQRYDVVLMNPPFGDPSKPSKSYIVKSYPKTKNDVYAAFVERGLSWLESGGMLGAITSRTGFFLSSFQKWREEILLQETTPMAFADLGYGVLDTAMVETAAYCLAKGQAEPDLSESLFMRLLTQEDKGAALEEVVGAIRSGRPHAAVHQVDPASFKQVPGSPFAYWVSERIRRLFTELPPFESEGRTAKQGLATADDFRFVRAWWEVSPDKILDGTNGPDWEADIERFQAWCRQRTREGKRWVPFAKGGSYSPYYADIHLVVNWENDGEEIRNFVDPDTGRTYSRPQNTDFYFRPGLTWPLRAARFAAYPLPAGSIFSVRGYAILAPTCEELEFLTGLGNSSTFDFIFKVMLGRFSFPEFIIGILQQLPVPDMNSSDNAVIILRDLTHTAIRLRSSSASEIEINHFFNGPMLSNGLKESLSTSFEIHAQSLAQIDDQLAELQEKIDNIAAEFYALHEEDRIALERQSNQTSEDEAIFDDEDDDRNISNSVDAQSLIHHLLSYALGCVFGRWDVRYATGEREAPVLPDPFAPLPVCSPGMHTGADSLPLKETPAGYPLEIDWDGVLVDDPDHEGDVIHRLRGVFELLFGERAEAIEREACEILGEQDLRSYFRKSSNASFWMQHVRQYSQSRRKAPIYWLLQSSKKNYALWFYYHRLDKDFLYKALINTVEPKLRLEDNRLEQLRAQREAAGTSGREAKQLEKQVTQQEEFLSELRDFEEKLRRAAELNLEPDLNDGVILNIAPLWELVPWKEAEKYWKALIEGKYDWSAIGQQLREKRLVE